MTARYSYICLALLYTAMSWVCCETILCSWNEIAIVAVAVISCGFVHCNACTSTGCLLYTDVCSAMIKCNDMLTICINVYHPELQPDRFAKCTRVLYPHWHCARAVLGESPDGYWGDGVLNKCGIYITHACCSSNNIVNYRSPCIIRWFPRHLQCLLWTDS